MSESSSEIKESESAEVGDVAAREQAERRARAQFAARRSFKRARRRAYNPYYFSLRSLLLTICLVIITALAGLALIVALRGEAAVPELEAVIEVVVAAASAADSGDDGRVGEPVATATSAVEVILAAETPAMLDLAGPAVPTVIITNTPVPLAVGVRAAVSNVGNDELNVRNIPNLRESQVLFRAREGTALDIIGGPQQADGFTWWQVNDPQFQVQGWAVANYLQTISEEAG